MTDDSTQITDGLSVSRETFDRLRALEALVRKWSPKINLVARTTLDDVWNRHILDSAQLSLIAEQNVDHWVDLGSGAGFPGLVVAILHHNATRTRHTLVESDQRKAAFLMTCVRELSLNARVLTNRIEQANPLGANVVSARALAPLPKLLCMVERHLAPDGIALLMKGQSAQSEIDEARKTWQFSLTTIQSQTEPTAKILRLERISRA